MTPSYLFYRKTGGSYLFRRPFHSISNRHLNLDSFNYLWVVASSDNPNKLSLYLNQVTQSLYNSIRENPEIKKLTISDIKDIVRTKLEKSKRYVQHYYLGTNRFSETDRLKSLLNNRGQEEQVRDELKQNC